MWRYVFADEEGELWLNQDQISTIQKNEEGWPVVTLSDGRVLTLTGEEYKQFLIDGGILIQNQ